MSGDEGVPLRTNFLVTNAGRDSQELRNEARRQAVARLSDVAQRDGLELDVMSVLLENAEDGEVLMRFSAFAYPPGKVPHGG